VLVRIWREPTVESDVPGRPSRGRKSCSWQSAAVDSPVGRDRQLPSFFLPPNNQQAYKSYPMSFSRRSSTPSMSRRSFTPSVTQPKPRSQRSGRSFSGSDAILVLAAIVFPPVSLLAVSAWWSRERDAQKEEWKHEAAIPAALSRRPPPSALLIPLDRGTARCPPCRRMRGPVGDLLLAHHARSAFLAFFSFPSLLFSFSRQ
jgi:hypothetical protein